MAYTAKKTQTPDKGGCLIRFEIVDHPETPTLECSTNKFESGKAILDRFKEWARQYGDVRLQ